MRRLTNSSLLIMLFMVSAMAFAIYSPKIIISTQNREIDQKMIPQNSYSALATPVTDSNIASILESWFGAGHDFRGGIHYIENCEIVINATSKYGIFIHEVTVPIYFSNVVIRSEVNPTMNNCTGIYFNHTSFNSNISNCHIYNIYRGIECAGANNWIDVHLTTIENSLSDGIYAWNSNTVIVRNCTIQNNGGKGVGISGGNSHTINSNIMINNEYGVFLTNVNGTILSLSYNQITLSGKSGVHMYGVKTLTTMNGNQVSNNTVDGIVASSNVFYTNPVASITNNQAKYNGRSGFVVQQMIGATINVNTAVNNSYSGAILGVGTLNTFTGNNFSGNYEYGMVIQSENQSTITGNYIEFNHKDGIVFNANTVLCTTSANTIRGNLRNGMVIEGTTQTIGSDIVSFNKLNGIVCSGDSNTFAINTAQGNTNDGIQLTGEDNTISSGNFNANGRYGAFVSATGNLLSGNYHNNNDSGIKVTGTANTLNDCKLNNNKHYGIIVEGNAQSLISNDLIGCGIFLTPDTIANMKSHSIPTTNLINGNSINYTFNQNNAIFTANYGQIIVINSTNSIIRTPTINSASTAVALYYSTVTTIDKTNMRYHAVSAVYAYASNNITINGSRIEDSAKAFEAITCNGIIMNYTTINRCNDTEATIDIRGDQFVIKNSIIADSSYTGINFEGNNGIIQNVSITNLRNSGIIGQGNSIIINRSYVFSKDSHGIYVLNSNFPSIISSNISSYNGNAVLLENNTFVSISNSQMNASKYSGLKIASTTGVSLIGNTFNASGIFMEGTLQAHFASHYIPQSNYRAGNLIYYYNNIYKPVLDATGGQEIIVANANETTILNIGVSGDYIGIQIYFSNIVEMSGTVSGCSRTNIYLFQTANTRINQMTIQNSVGNGIESIESTGLYAYKAHFTSNYIGINGSNTNSSTITGCIFTSNTYGIHLKASYFNDIKESQFLGSAFISINIENGQNNIVQTTTFTTIGTSAGIRLFDTSFNEIKFNTVTLASSTVVLLINADSNVIQDLECLACQSTQVISGDANSMQNQFIEITITFTNQNSNNIGISIAGDNTVVYNTVIEGAQIGIVLNGVDAFHMTTSTMKYCNIGLNLQSITNARINYNTFFNCSQYGIWIDSSNDIEIENNVIRGSDYGIFASNSDEITVRLNTFCFNDFSNVAGNGITETLSSACSNLETTNESNQGTQQTGDSGINTTLVFFLKYIIPVPLFVLGFFSGKFIYLRRKNLA